MVNAPSSIATQNDGLADNLLSFYSCLSLDGLSKLKNIYSEDVVFIDPIGSHRGLVSLTHYFERLLTNCSQCRCKITSQHFDDSYGSIEWSMSFAHPRLNKGREVEIRGISVMDILDNKIIYQRDFYDMGAMIYEHLPLIGGIIKYLRKRMM